jgi:hypothetical protein
VQDFRRKQALTRCESETRRRPASISLTGEAHEEVGEPLRRLWRKARSCFPSSLGPSLLPQSLQVQLSCEVNQRPCAYEKVVRLLCSRNNVAAGTPSGPACRLRYVPRLLFFRSGKSCRRRTACCARSERPIN